MKELTDKERAFVKAYTEGPTAGNASKSATYAGYSNGKQAGHEVLKRQHVLAAIERALRRLKGENVPEPEPEPEKIRQTPGRIYPLPVVTKMQEDANEGAQRGSGGPETDQAYHEADEDKAARLDRPYVIAALMDSFEISLGRRPTTITQMAKKASVDENGRKTEEIVAVKVEVFQRDANAANRTGELLLKEVERMEADPGSKTNEMEGRESLVEAVEAFRQGRAA